jgi:hypothetical protein
MFNYKATRHLVDFLQRWGKIQRAFRARVAANHRQWALEREARKPLPKWKICGSLQHYPSGLCWFVQESPYQTGLTFQQAEELADVYSRKEVENLLWEREDAMRRIRIDDSIAEARAAANCSR